MISPSRCGTLILFSNNGTQRMMISSSKNFKSGSSIGKLTWCMLSNIAYCFVDGVSSTENFAVQSLNPVMVCVPLMTFFWISSSNTLIFCLVVDVLSAVYSSTILYSN